MTKQRLEKEFTDEEMESIAQDFRIGMQEEPDDNEELFPNDAQQLRDYITTLEENIKHKPTEHLREELRVYKAHQTGLYKGICFGFEYLMAEKEKQAVMECEDAIANNVSTKKVFNYLEKQKKVNPERLISKKELLKKSKLTRKDLEKAGIQNTGRYLVEEEPKRKRK